MFGYRHKCDMKRTKATRSGFLKKATVTMKSSDSYVLSEERAKVIQSWPLDSGEGHRLTGLETQGYYFCRG